MIAVEGHQLRPVHRVERRFGLAGPRVGMLAEQRGAERPVRQELRRRLLLRHRLQMLLLEDRHLVLGNRRVHRDVGNQVDEARRELRQAADRHRREVLRRGRRQRPAHAEDVAPDLAAVLGLRPFLDQVRGQRREAGEIRRIARVAGQHRQRDRDLRNRRLPRDDDPQPVGQCLLDPRRELKRPLGSDGRSLLSEGRSGHGDEHDERRTRTTNDERRTPNDEPRTTNDERPITSHPLPAADRSSCDSTAPGISSPPAARRSSSPYRGR